MGVFVRLLLSLSMCPLAGAQASTVHRCESLDGAITFTDLGCPENATMSVQEAFNPAPGGGEAGLLPERERQWPQARPGPSPGARVTIVDSREPSPASKPRSKPQTAKSPR